MKNDKVSLYLLAAVVILGASLICYWFFTQNSSRQVKVNSKQPDSGFQITKRDTSASEISKELPKNFPVEAGSVVLKNNEVRSSDGRLQITRVVTTSKNLTDASNLFIESFKSDGWVVISSKPQGDTFESVLKSGNDTAQIIASPTGDIKNNQVEINLVKDIK